MTVVDHDCGEGKRGFQWMAEGWLPWLPVANAQWLPETLGMTSVAMVLMLLAAAEGTELYHACVGFHSNMIIPWKKGYNNGKGCRNLVKKFNRERRYYCTVSNVNYFPIGVCIPGNTRHNRKGVRKHCETWETLFHKFLVSGTTGMFFQKHVSYRKQLKTVPIPALPMQSQDYEFSERHKLYSPRKTPIAGKAVFAGWHGSYFRKYEILETSCDRSHWILCSDVGDLCAKIWVSA